MANPAIPAPCPDMPTKCSVEMLAAMSENPMSGQTRLRPARKKSSPVLSLRLWYMLTPTTTAKNSTKIVRSSQCSVTSASVLSPDFGIYYIQDSRHDKSNRVSICLFI